MSSAISRNYFCYVDTTTAHTDNDTDDDITTDKYNLVINTLFIFVFASFCFCMVYIRLEKRKITKPISISRKERVPINDIYTNNQNNSLLGW